MYENIDHLPSNYLKVVIIAYLLTTTISAIWLSIDGASIKQLNEILIPTTCINPNKYEVYVNTTILDYFPYEGLLFDNEFYNIKLINETYQCFWNPCRQDFRKYYYKSKTYFCDYGWPSMNNKRLYYHKRHYVSRLMRSLIWWWVIIIACITFFYCIIG